ncbi:MAG TPA: hypothetical protein VK251_03250 [Steroidobacteraceae bacterium]|nr:hypothetical protein [Steroidobacteraceae bacterium]
MGVLKFSALSLAAALLQGCSSGEPPAAPSAAAPPPEKTVFDPLTQQLDRARDVQKTIDQGADKTRTAVDSQERGDASP